MCMQVSSLQRCPFREVLYTVQFIYSLIIRATLYILSMYALMNGVEVFEAYIQ